MDFTNQPKPTSTHITDHPAESPTDPDYPPPTNVRRKTDFLGYFLVFLGVIALTALMAVIGGWPLVTFAFVVAGLGLIHYWTWGRGLGRKLADEHAKQFRESLDVDPATLSEVERPRHY